MSVCLPACSKLSCLSVCLSTCPSACLSVLRGSLLIHKDVPTSVSVYLFVFFTVCLSVCQFIRRWRTLCDGAAITSLPASSTSFYTLTAIFSPYHQDGSIKSFYCNLRNFRKQKFLRLWFSRVNFL